MSKSMQPKPATIEPASRHYSDGWSRSKLVEQIRVRDQCLAEERVPFEERLKHLHGQLAKLRWEKLSLWGLVRQLHGMILTMTPVSERKYLNTRIAAVLGSAALSDDDLDAMPPGEEPQR